MKHRVKLHCDLFAYVTLHSGSNWEKQFINSVVNIDNCVCTCCNVYTKQNLIHKRKKKRNVWPLFTVDMILPYFFDDQGSKQFVNSKPLYISLQLLRKLSNAYAYIQQSHDLVDYTDNSNSYRKCTQTLTLWQAWRSAREFTCRFLLFSVMSDSCYITRLNINLGPKKICQLFWRWDKSTIQVYNNNNIILSWQDIVQTFFLYKFCQSQYQYNIIYTETVWDQTVCQYWFCDIYNI